MCRFFSCIITRDGRVLFYDGNSHEAIIDRAGLHDDNVVYRSFQRVEVRERYHLLDGPTILVDVDEAARAAWLTDEMLEKAKLLRERVEPIYNAYRSKLQLISERDVSTRRQAERRYSEATMKLFLEGQDKERVIREKIEPEIDVLYQKARDLFVESRTSEGYAAYSSAFHAADSKKAELLEQNGVPAMWDKYRIEDARLVRNRQRSVDRSFRRKSKEDNEIAKEYAASLSGIEGYLPPLPDES